MNNLFIDDLSFNKGLELQLEADYWSVIEWYGLIYRMLDNRGLRWEFFV